MKKTQDLVLKNSIPRSQAEGVGPAKEAETEPPENRNKTRRVRCLTSQRERGHQCQ